LVYFLAASFAFLAASASASSSSPNKSSSSSSAFFAGAAGLPDGTVGLSAFEQHLMLPEVETTYGN